MPNAKTPSAPATRGRGQSLRLLRWWRFKCRTLDFLDARYRPISAARVNRFSVGSEKNVACSRCMSTPRSCRHYSVAGSDRLPIATADSRLLRTLENCESGRELKCALRPSASGRLQARSGVPAPCARRSRQAGQHSDGSCRRRHREQLHRVDRFRELRQFNLSGPSNARCEHPLLAARCGHSRARWPTFKAIQTASPLRGRLASNFEKRTSSCPAGYP